MRQSRTEHPIASIRLDGGRPCLNFVNTIHDRSAAYPEDYLSAAQRYLEWCVRAQLLEETEAARIEVDLDALAEARGFRESLHAVFTAQICGAPAPATALALLDRWVHCAWASLVIDPGSARYVSWPDGAIDARLPLKRVAINALDLLRDGNPKRLKQCAAADSCGWLFYDDTRNGGRRWCAMATCGTVAKMREYRAS